MGHPARAFCVAAFAAAAAFNFSPANDSSLVSMISSAQAQAASTCLPGIYNPSHPVQPGDCYIPAEFNKIMRAEGQQPVIVGNRNAGAYKYGEYFTYNGQKGYNAELDVPYEGKSSASTARVRAVYINMQVNNVDASNRLPSWAANIDDSQAREICRGPHRQCAPFNEYVQRNTTAPKDNRIMMMAQTVNSPSADGQWKLGKRITLFRDMVKGDANVGDIDSRGAYGAAYGMAPVAYTQFASRYMEQTQASADTLQGTVLATYSPAAK